MGVFIEPNEMKAYAPLVPVVNQLDDPQLDVLFIVPAERAISEEFNLDLDTDSEPRHWAGRFTTRPDLRESYFRDYKHAVIHLVNRAAANPNGFTSHSLSGGGGATFGPSFPDQVYTLMRRWGRPKRLNRV
jgi:hypothetical protein